MSAVRPAQVLRFSVLIVAVALLCGSVCLAGELVTDEATRLRVVRLAFPNGQISTLPPQPFQKPYPVKDPLNRVIAVIKNALEHGPEYEVIGPVAKNEEAPASYITDLNHIPSNKRQVQIHLY
jgi:hypothetical protein